METGLHEPDSGIRCVENFGTRGSRRSEDANPQLAADIRDVVEPRTQADPELKSARQYTSLSAREVRERLIFPRESGQCLSGYRGDATARTRGGTRRSRSSDDDHGEEKLPCWVGVKM